MGSTEADKMERGVRAMEQVKTVWNVTISGGSEFCKGGGEFDPSSCQEDLIGPFTSLEFRFSGSDFSKASIGEHVFKPKDKAENLYSLELLAAFFLDFRKDGRADEARKILLSKIISSGDQQLMVAIDAMK